MISTLLLRNARVPTLALQLDALADFGTIHVCIPQHVCERLRLEKLAEREVVLADGTAKVVPYVGPLEVRFKNRAGFTGALVIGDQVVLGAIAMEDMDLVVLPGTRQLDVNPGSPGIGRSIASRVRAVSEPPGRYVLRRALRVRESCFSADSPEAPPRARSRASRLP
jgi:clan AA aspartic protease